MLLERMINRQSSNLSALSDEWKESIAFYRFLSNPSVGECELLQRCTHFPASRADGREVLVLSDTVSVPFRCKRRSRDEWRHSLGVVEDNSTPGLYMHAALCIDSSSEQVKGLASLALYSRPYVAGDDSERKLATAQRQKLPHQSKEGYAWLLVAREASAQLCTASRAIHVMDRGADIYDTMYGLMRLEQGHDFIIRQKEDRLLRATDGTASPVRLRERLSASPVAGRAALKIRELNHPSKTSGKWVERKQRECSLSIRFCRVEVAVPKGKAALPKPLWAVDAVEDPSTVPEGEPPIHWTLWTSCPVASMAEALHVIASYRKRWWIEQLFRILKKDGMDIEHTQIRNPSSLKKQLIMEIKASSEVLKLVSVRNGEVFVPIEEVFDKADQEVLEKIAVKLDGGTEKGKNPHSKESLAWAAWIIARLGGWKGLASQRPPGPETMSIGMRKFADIKWFVSI
jgi:hypothetical protein